MQIEHKSDAVVAAVNSLRRHAALRSHVQQGIDQIERGQYIELDETGIDDFFREIFGPAAVDSATEEHFKNNSSGSTEARSGFPLAESQVPP